MKKSLIALLLVVALVVTVSVFAASAETTNPFEGQTGDVTAVCPACGTEQTWKAVTSANAGSSIQNWPGASTGTTHFYYAEDITCTSGTTLTTEKFCVNLNGKTITRAKASGSSNLRFFTIKGTDAENAPVLNLMDTSVGETGKMVIPMSGEGFFQVAYESVCGTVNVHSGTYFGSGVEGGTSTSSGTLINCLDLQQDTNGDGTKEVIDRGGTAHFNFYGGTLKGASKYSCGLLNLKDGTTVTIDGATLDGKCGGGTGGVCVLNHDTKLYLKSGSLTGGLFSTADGWGSTIKMFSKSRFEMSGGTLTGTTKGHTHTSSSGLNKSYHGGGIYAEGSATALISGGTISGCTASGNSGGSIYWNSTGTLEMTGGTITGGTAKRISGCTHNGNAGNVYINKGTFEMSGGTIDGNKDADQSAHCGNLYLAAGVVCNITGGTITNGRTTNYGGNIYAFGAKLTIDAAEGKTVKITNGRGGGGGNIYIREDKAHTSAFANITGPDVTISGGNATNGNGTGSSAARTQCGSQIMLYGYDPANVCTLTLTDVKIDSDEVHTDELALYDNAELKVGGTKNIDCAYITNANGKVTVLPGYTGEMHVRWFDSAIHSKVAPGAAVDASLSYEEGYTGTGIIKACNSSRSGKIASIDGKGGFFIAGFGGFNYNAETEKYEETPLATMPTDKDAFAFIRSYLDNDATIVLGCDTVLDINNAVYTVTTGDYKLGLIETRSSEFTDNKAADSTDPMTGCITVDNAANVLPVTKLVNGTQYITLPFGENGGFTARRVSVDIDSVSIKPATAGIYYTTSMNTSPLASGYAASYGVVLSLVDMPGADFVSEDSNADDLVDNLYTEIDFTPVAGEPLSVQGANSALLVGILNQGAPEGQNDAWGTKPIYANAFVCFNIDGKNVYVMADKTYTLSLKDIMQLVDKLDPTNAGVQKMYGTWQDPLAQWELTNIKAAYDAANA